MKEKNLDKENKRRSFKPCFVEVVRFGEDIILTSDGASSTITNPGEGDNNP